MYQEMQNTMECNFQGTPLNKYKQAKKLFLEGVEDCIEQNKDDLIEEVKNESKRN